MTTAAQHPYFDRPPLALAHRGGAGYGPNVGIENTVRAFRTAVELGYRYLETDVHATRDGHVVAIHDDRLDRVTDGHGPIARLPWSSVRTARVGGSEAVPELDELFETFPSSRFNIDIKAPGAVAPLWRAITRHGAHDRVCVGSFSNWRLAAFRRLAGRRVATAAGPAGTAGLRFLPTWASRLAHSPAPVLQVPTTHPLAGRTVRLVTPGLVRTAHRLGKQVHVWTVDDADEMTRLLDLGVDGLVTDRIDTLRDVLAARGQWR